MINIFYRYKMPPQVEAKLQFKTVPLSEARPIVEHLHTVAEEILIEHVPMSKMLAELHNGTRPYPTDKAVRLK